MFNSLRNDKHFKIVYHPKAALSSFINRRLNFWLPYILISSNDLHHTHTWRANFNFIIKHYKRINISIVSILHLPLVIQGFKSSDNGSWRLSEQRRPILLVFAVLLDVKGHISLLSFLGKNLDIVDLTSETLCPSHRLNLGELPDTVDYTSETIICPSQRLTS